MNDNSPVTSLDIVTLVIAIPGLIAAGVSLFWHGRTGRATFLRGFRD